MDIRKLLYTPLGLILIAMLGYLCKYALNLFLSNNMSAAQYGDLSLGLNLLFIVASFSLIGTNIIANRFLSPMLSKSNINDANKYVSWNFTLIQKVAIGVIVVFSLILALMVNFHVYNIQAITKYHITIYLLFLTPVYAVMIIMTAYLNAAKNTHISLFCRRILYYLVLLCFFVTVVYFTEKKINNLQIILVYFSVLMLLVLLMLFKFNHSTGIILENHVSIHRNLENYPRSKEWLKAGLAVAFSGLVYSIMGVYDLLTLELMSHKINESQVGYYAAASMITGILYLVSGNMLNTVKPLVCELTQENKIDELQKIINKALYSGLIITLLISGVLVFYRYELLSFFGPSYESASTVVLLLIVTAIISFISRVATMLLLLNGHEKYLLKVNLFVFVIFFAICPLMTFYLGMFGTAASNVIIFLLNSLIVCCRARKTFPEIKQFLVI